MNNRLIVRVQFTVSSRY